MCFLFYFHLLRFFFISFLLTQKGASLSKNGTFFKRVQTEIVLKYVWHWHSWTSIGKLRSNWTISIKKNIYWIIKNSRSFDFLDWRNVQIYRYEDYLFQKCSIFRWQCRMHPITPTSTTFRWNRGDHFYTGSYISSFEEEEKFKKKKPYISMRLVCCVLI